MNFSIHIGTKAGMIACIKVFSPGSALLNQNCHHSSEINIDAQFLVSFLIHTASA